MTRPAVLEVGPATVRGLGALTGPGICEESVAAALDGIDDPVVLVGEQPVSVERLWGTLLAGLTAGADGPVLMVHPSWWPRARVDRVRAACARPSVAVTRAEVIARRRGRPAVPAVVVEVAAGLVAVSGQGEVAVLAGGDPVAVAEAVGRLGGVGAGVSEVLLDVPPGVPGADRTAAAIRVALWDYGIDAVDVDVAALALDPAPGPAAGSGCRGRLRWPAGAGRAAIPAGAVVAGAVVAGVVVAGVVTAGVPAVLGAWGAIGPDGPPRGPRAAPSLVEGRVAVAIPPDWPVSRVTAGPGSRRVQVDSPSDPDAALHITQSHTPGAGLAQAAEVLGRAVAAARPAGVFVDFRPDDRTAGRPAVTYREVRPGRVIRWSVLQDGATRISIGCQSAPRREDAIAAACREAVRSARELGTPGRPR